MYFKFLPVVKLIKGSISLVRSLFKGTYCNTQMDELCAVYSSVWTKQGQKVVKKIQYLLTMEVPFVIEATVPVPELSVC